MIYILIGGDNYTLREKIKELSNNNFQIVNPQKDKNNLIVLIDNFINRRLFDQTPTIVIENCEKLEWSDEILFDKFKKGNFILILKEANKVLINKLKKFNLPYQEIKLVNLSFKNEIEFKKFLMAYLENKKIKITNRLINVLSKIFFNNPSLLLNELKKIEFIQISEEEILSIIKWPNDSMIFQLIDDLVEAKYDDFILRLNREINLGTPLNNIFSLIYKTLIRLYLLKKSQNVSQENFLGLKYYYKQILKIKAQKISEDKILKIIEILSQIERRYKKFLMTEREAIYYLGESLKFYFLK
jgi:DNA polymerase III delta subunit